MFCDPVLWFLSHPVFPFAQRRKISYSRENSVLVSVYFFSTHERVGGLYKDGHPALLRKKTQM